MDIFNTKVDGIVTSLIASGYPKSINVEEDTCYEHDATMKRGKLLGSCKPGTGHDCYLKGIIVSADVEAPLYWWKQFQRYHFADIISSQSTMHKITEMDIYKQTNKYVLPDVIKVVEELVDHYKKFPTQENFQFIISNVPQGLNLTARIVTNYLQLKTIKQQRKGHKLEEWKSFIEWIDMLPFFIQLTAKEK